MCRDLSESMEMSYKNTEISKQELCRLHWIKGYFLPRGRVWTICSSGKKKDNDKTCKYIRIFLEINTTWQEFTKNYHHYQHHQHWHHQCNLQTLMCLFMDQHRTSTNSVIWTSSRCGNKVKTSNKYWWLISVLTLCSKWKLTCPIYGISYQTDS